MAGRVKELLGFAANPLTLMPEYENILKELRWYKQLALALPERVAFPLFEVGTSQVKHEI
jgi:hypothetical protein